jgi:hypothetical protein
MSADPRGAFDRYVRDEPAILPELDVRTENAIRPDLTGGGNFSARMDDGGSVN